MVDFRRSVFSLSGWILLLLLLHLLNLPLQVIAMLGLHSCAPDEYWSKHFCCKSCPAGMFVHEPCTIPHTQGQCETCHPGSFTERDNGLDDCMRCSTCDKNQEMVADCSATSDRKCQCQTRHYYSDPESPESCRQCTKCPQGIPVLQECNSTANTVCSLSASNHRDRQLLLLPSLSVLIFAIVVYYIL
ncbi:tumor necrosis factor receptor superfamily member 22-like [Apodemus sylvaticus]|uniref:tumor necrosis factor receptor superfamily member 22-like n=1 Tax=Apodemus sylvaticus TaxID=10129 RepID=UPI00224195B3|nr:tumor necrosis factor receptor superfamily member 22-like [Apodemus sylvaticus]